MHEDRRKKWCEVMNRNSIGPRSKSYVCEDHFDLGEDLENYIKFKLVGGQVKLKPCVLPHKFDCQNNPEKLPRIHSGKRLRNTSQVSTSSFTEESEFVGCGQKELRLDSHIGRDVSSDRTKRMQLNKSIQLREHPEKPTTPSEFRSSTFS
ncbi:hypothetical protein JTB14_006654 [Gonioctena quinquepunctata]|nr:hypothetical protein JTB14_006654 [Gonioctena quinquepunctata]